MKDNCRESLSALMDNEGDELELRRVLKTADGEQDDFQAWRRYHLARSLMHRDRSIDVHVDVSGHVLAALEDEPVPQAPTKESPSRAGGLSLAGSAAVAAAVSLMVITGVQFYNGAGSSDVLPDMASSLSNDTGSSPVKSGAASDAQPASLSNGNSLPPRAVTELPAFRAPSAFGGGVMEVGASTGMPLFMAPQQRHSQGTEREQARLLQHYLERHADGAAHRTGEAWIPLLRASSQETLGSR